MNKITNITLLDNTSKNIPYKITYLYDNDWFINPLNYKWKKNSYELNLNEAYCIEVFNNSNYGK